MRQQGGELVLTQGTLGGAAFLLTFPAAGSP